ncbi:unnamed protein product [Spirodela intermedia]|uniref:Uncharacterized protein n=1 Tax=Spirodela intermedia TaxID=51605 RepID=A0A7I8L4P2_SPIIN|nr:unnamed protein product [Spirodela intermedia]
MRSTCPSKSSLQSPSSAQPFPVVTGLFPRRPSMASPLPHGEEADVPVLPPVRHAVVLEEGQLLDLLQHVLVQPRGVRFAGAVVGDVDVHRVGGLAQVGGGVADEPHEEAVVELDATEGAGPQVPELLHVGDKAGDLGHWDADRRLMVEQPADSRIPCAYGEKAVILAEQTGS